MNGSLKIRQLIFSEQGLMLIIQRKANREFFHCHVAELFCNDELLAEFNFTDIRLISYFAAIEEHESDRNLLKVLRKERL